MLNEFTNILIREMIVNFSFNFRKIPFIMLNLK